MKTPHHRTSTSGKSESYWKNSPDFDFFESGSNYDPAILDDWLNQYYKDWGSEIYSADAVKDLASSYKQYAPATFGSSQADNRWTKYMTDNLVMPRQNFIASLVSGSMPYAHATPGWNDLLDYMEQYQNQFGTSGKGGGSGGGYGSGMPGTNFSYFPNIAGPGQFGNAHANNPAYVPEPISFSSPGGYQNWYQYWQKNGGMPVTPGSINPSTPYVAGNVGGNVGNMPVGQTMSRGSAATAPKRIPNNRIGTPQGAPQPAGQYNTSYGPTNSSLNTAQLPQKQGRMYGSRINQSAKLRRNYNRNSPSQRRVR